MKQEVETLVRVPAEVVGRTRPSSTPLASERQTADANAFGAQAFQSLGRVGKALQQGALALRERRTREATMRANIAMSTFQLDQDRVLDDLNRNKTEFSNIDVLYEDQYNENINTLLESIEDPEARAHAFNLGVKLFAKNTLAAQNMERERNTAAVNLNLTQTIESARNVVRRDPASLDDQVEIVLDALQQTGGVLPRVEIEGRVRAYLQGLNVSAQQGRADQNPELVISELTSGVTHTPGEADLVYSESGGNPRVVNSEGYAGLYQFGAPRLADIGIYTPAEGESLRDWQGSWQGEFRVPGHPNVKSLGDFLAAPDAQHTAYKLHRQKMDQEIRDNNFDRFIGKHVQGVLITQQGLRNMLHLGGVGSTRTFLSGKGNPQDSNGTSLADYAAMGAQGPQSVVPLEELLTPQQMEGLRSYAQGVMDDRIRRQEALETQSAQVRTEQQESNFGELRVGVAEGTTDKASILEALERRRVSTQQARTLLADLDTENAAASEQTALELETGIYLGETNLDRIMDTPMTTGQRRDLVRRWQGFEQQGGVLASDNAQRALRYIKSTVGAIPGPLGRLDAGAVRREANALRVAADRIQAGEDPWQVADEISAQFRPSAPDINDIIPPRGFSGGVMGQPQELINRSTLALEAFTKQYEAGEITINEYTSIAEEHATFIQQLEQIQSMRELQRERSNNARK